MHIKMPIRDTSVEQGPLTKLLSPMDAVQVTPNGWTHAFGASPENTGVGFGSMSAEHGPEYLNTLRPKAKR